MVHAILSKRSANRQPFRSWFIALLYIPALLIPISHANANDQPVPWECSNYSGDAQTRCLNTFIDLQREEIGRLKGQLQAQQGTVEQLKQQSDRQAAAVADLQRQQAAPPTIVPAPAYTYTYIYPPAIGLGLSFGRPWVYGPPYYYRPHIYWGPHYYRHWGHRR